MISTPFHDDDGRGEAEADKKRMHKPSHDKPEEGVISFNPNEDIAKVAAHKGWSKDVQGQKWLEVFTQIMMIIQEKREADPANGSSVRIMCNGRPPPPTAEI